MPKKTKLKVDPTHMEVARCVAKIFAYQRVRKHGDVLHWIKELRRHIDNVECRSQLALHTGASEVSVPVSGAIPSAGKGHK